MARKKRTQRRRPDITLEICQDRYKPDRIDGDKKPIEERERENCESTLKDIR